MLRFFTDPNAGSMFSRLPVEDAVRWLEEMNGSDSRELMGFAERAYARGRYRDALAAAARVRTLDEGGSLGPRLNALSVEIDAKARPVAERLTTAMTQRRDGSWVDDFWAFRAEFGLAPAAESCLAAYAGLRKAHDEPAEQLFSEIQSELNEGLRRAKLRELVGKYYASKWYKLAKRLLN